MVSRIFPHKYLCNANYYDILTYSLCPINTLNRTFTVLHYNKFRSSSNSRFQSYKDTLKKPNAVSKMKVPVLNNYFVRTNKMTKNYHVNYFCIKYYEKSSNQI